MVPLNVKQAAERLGVSRSLVYELCRQRLLRHERVGVGRGVIRIPEEALEEYRRAHAVEQSPTSEATLAGLKFIRVN